MRLDGSTLSRIVMGLALCTVLSAEASAEGPLIPVKPNPYALVKKMKRPFGSIGIFETVVVKYAEGQYEVLYGLILGKMNQDSVVYVENADTGLSCAGETRKLADGSGAGTISCSRSGVVESISPVEIAAGTYGRMNGIDSGVVLDPQGQQIGVVISQWSAWDFPEPAKIFDKFN